MSVCDVPVISSVCDAVGEGAASLIAAGYRLAVCELYAARGVARLPDAAADALAGRRLDGALHYSRRSAQAAHDLANAAGLGGAGAVGAGGDAGGGASSSLPEQAPSVRATATPTARDARSPRSES